MAMHVERSQFREAAKEQLTNEERYNATFRRLAYALVYDDLSIDQLEKRIDLAMDDEGLARRNEKRKGMELLRHLAEAMEWHEHGNVLFREWQQALAKEAHPEQLTREQVAALFDGFAEKDALLKAEQQAMDAYTALLDTRENVDIPLTESITIRRADIEMFVNDLKTRVAERMPDADARKAALDALDEEVEKIVPRLGGEDEEGVQLELKEMYLLRRLIHRMDTGHLVSVEHAPTREDLRWDLDKVDMYVAVAGDVHPLQVKTFARVLHQEGRDNQARILREARQDLEGTETQLVVLERQSVRDAYERALGENRWVTVSDKYDALHPLTEIPSLSAPQRERLLSLTGLTEENLTEEAQAREERYSSLQEGQAHLRLREGEIQTYLQELEATERAQAQARRAEIEAQAAERIRERSQTVQQRRAAALQRAHERTALAEQRKREEAARAAEEARTAAERAKRSAVSKKAAATRKEKEAAGWPPKTLQGIVNAPLLQRFGFLPDNWQPSDPKAFLTAKQRFLETYAKPKPDGSITDRNVPNQLFKNVFTSPEDLQHPPQQAA